MANEQASSLEGMLGELMRDPAKMAQLTQMAASLGLSLPTSVPDSSPPTEETPTTPDTTEAPSLPASLNLDPATVAGLSGLLPLFTGGQSGGSSGKPKPDHRTALLLALKPYLSDNRCAMIDAIVNFNRLGSMLGQSKGG